jgi:hypothetical protein
MILRDEGLSQLSMADLSNPQNNWYVPVPAGRDLQLVGNNRVLLGTANGYEERNIKDGAKVAELTSHPGTQTAHRLRNGNTLLAGINWQNKQGIVLLEVNNAGAIQKQIVYPGFTYVRCVRQTANGNFVVTSNNQVFEGDDKGNILWKGQISLSERPDSHIWQGIKTKNGQTVVAAGYANSFQIFQADGKLVRKFTGPAEVHPHFFAGFQIMPNGNYVVANWQGHGPKLGASGHQVLEFTPEGKLVWSFKQDETKYSSIQGVLVLDNLDTSKLHAEDEDGKLVPVN